MRATWPGGSAAGVAPAKMEARHGSSTGPVTSALRTANPSMAEQVTGGAAMRALTGEQR
jgi:hypothetical protein